MTSEFEPGQALNPTLQRLLSLCRMDRTWVRGEGVHLFDEKGRRFLDCYAQYGAVALGHNAPVVNAAVRAALDASEPAMVQPYQAPWAEALAGELVRQAPAGLTRCVFTTSGAETVEAAIKLVRSRTGRRLIVSAEGSFHGKTMGALAATGQRHHSDGFGAAPSGFTYVPFGDVGALERVFAANGSQIAALILEPIQGEGGVNLPPPGYLPRARALCTEHGAALILDEVQTGLGRTGRMFACEHEGVTPDVLLIAKALGGGLFPIGACLTTNAFWDERFALKHSSTFANNNVGSRVGLAVLGELKALVPEVAAKGVRLQAGLAELAAKFPTVIAAVRGQGLLGGIALRPVHADAGMLMSYLQYQGLYAYAVASTIAELTGVLAGGTPIALRPPMITDLESDTLRTFLSSSWFAEDEAAPTVARLLEQPCDDEERKLLLSYAAEEHGHAALIAKHFQTHNLQFGKPFWIQRVFRLARSRPTMLLQMYTIEVLACFFYAAMAKRTRDKEAQALIKILLRDEARHIRLTRELLARELARQPPLGRLKARALAAILRVGVGVTAWVQSRQLRPVLGETGFTFSVKLVKLLSAERAAIFRQPADPVRSLAWWWVVPAGAAFGA